LLDAIAPILVLSSVHAGTLRAPERGCEVGVLPVRFLRLALLGHAGPRPSALPDFFIGTHAAVADLGLLTRDATRYRTYFPSVRLTFPGK
jgi:hypothetical protein